MDLKVHEVAKQQIEGLIKTPGGSVLLHGPSSVDKRQIALEIARQINCAGCLDQSCSSCRMVAGGSHPDVVTIDPDEKGKIGIEAVHNLRHQLHFSEYQPGSRRVVIIANAETLTLPAQNALLKTLEEPPAGTTIIVTAISPASLLETIVSRCRPLYVAPLGSEVSPGSTGDVQHLADALANESDLFKRLQSAAEISKQADRLDDCLEALTVWAQKSARTNPRLGAANLAATESLRRRIAANVNPKVALEAFAVEAVC